MGVSGGMIARWRSSYVEVVNPCLTWDMATVRRPGARRYFPVPAEELNRVAAAG